MEDHLQNQDINKIKKKQNPHTIDTHIFSTTPISILITKKTLYEIPKNEIIGNSRANRWDRFLRKGIMDRLFMRLVFARIHRISICISAKYLYLCSGGPSSGL